MRVYCTEDGGTLVCDEGGCRLQSCHPDQHLAFRLRILTGYVTATQTVGLTLEATNQHVDAGPDAGQRDPIVS